MTISALSRYRGGTAEQVLPLSRALKSIYARHGVGYRLGRIQDGANAGDWCVIVTYPDDAARARAEAAFAGDDELQRIFTAIAAFARRQSREIIEDFEL